ncbi:MAG: hypothetical protein KUG81_07710 [Gammaproteobacteria bacterium]|nr:hypothetical protein [Gammaproteobacteria bacterium]
MSKKIHPADALKPIDQVLVADPRNECIELAEWHSKIAEIVLVETTPVEVKQLFENAKNIALYTYFAYRLHQPAEVIGYTALEKALKLKFEIEQENIILEKSPKTLADYMDVALNQGWIKSEGYNSFRQLASSRVQQKKIVKLIKSGALDHQESTPIPESEEHEIIAEMRDMGIAERVLHAGRHIRNFHAHGNGGLSPSAICTLEKIAEEINQLYSGSFCGTRDLNTIS